ncbi:hypothetical protein K402DRAFT_422834 [Aulographum hederae CBS 113979]|uniref:DUF3074 domain-containing protein n=1 Tax=Aulographum hederae CBS 113979 TaxID=1176131 RepID=A0A6G1GUM8_9PEZI|nr:hypothetical protein K402DRAFT_422834 [Aulographum hederae CBS 113979]
MAPTSPPKPSPRTLLRLQPLSPKDLPPHPTLSDISNSTPKSPPKSPPKGPPSPSFFSATPPTAPKDEEATALATFAARALKEAEDFIEAAPTTFREKGWKRSPPWEGRVRVLEGLSAEISSRFPVARVDRGEGAAGGVVDVVGETDKKKMREAWFGRRSIHETSPSSPSSENPSKTSQPNFPTFDKFLRKNHSLNEKAYTPAVFAAKSVLDYGKVPDGAVDGWRDVEVGVWEMGHRMPWPLRGRAFGIIVVSGRKISSASVSSSATVLESGKIKNETGKGGETKDRKNVKNGKPEEGHEEEDSDTSLIVQLPVDLARVPTAFFATHSNRNHGSTSEEEQKMVLGKYVSVEKISLRFKNGNVADSGGGNATAAKEIVWEMVTASDAGGWLPMALQKLGVPGAICKDVGFFLGWVRREGGVV